MSAHNSAGGMSHLVYCLQAAVRHPGAALLGVREFKSGVGMTYGDWSKSEAYDAGRELAHMLTLRHWEAM